MAVTKTQTKLNESARDMELVLEARAGSCRAFEELVTRYEKRVFRFVFLKTGNVSDAEDLTQQAFVKAYRNLDRFDPSYRFSTWMFTIAGRLAASHYRSLKGRKEVAHPDPGVNRVDESDPALQLESEESAGKIWSSVKVMLTENQFTAMWLKYGEDFSIKEIAVAMNRTQMSVKVILHRARRKLADNFKTYSHFREAILENGSGTDIAGHSGREEAGNAVPVI